MGIAKIYGWTNNKILSNVSVEYSKKIGIKASPQYEFRINCKGLEEIYSLAGPLCIKDEYRCIKFHINRSKNM